MLFDLVCVVCRRSVCVCTRYFACGLLGLPIGVWFEKRDLDEKESNQSTKNFIDPSSNKYTFATFPYN